MPVTPTRGIISENSPVYRIFLLYYRPHSGIGGKTPAEADGITIRGRGKWRTQIRNPADATQIPISTSFYAILAGLCQKPAQNHAK